MRKDGTVKFRLPEELKRKAFALAAAERCTLSEVLRALLMSWVLRKDKKGEQSGDNQGAYRNGREW
mgnify:CR=1 FL=1